jgi:hypothetical protein
MPTPRTVAIALVLAIQVLTPLISVVRAEPPENAEKIINHLEFLGYTVTADKDSLLAKHTKEWNISVRSYQGGILIAAFLEAEKKAKEDRGAFLEMINALNKEAKACRYYADKDGDLAIEAYYPGSYDKARFGTFIDVWKADSDELKGNKNALSFLK